MTSAELSKEDLIKREYVKIRRLFSAMPENKRKLMDPMMQKCAFMSITLDFLQAEINEGGATEEYKNGENQKGVKASAQIQAYNATMKNYQSAMKILAEMLPEQQKKSKLEKFMND